MAYYLNTLEGRPLIPEYDPRLRMVSQPVEKFDASLNELIGDMFATLAGRGVGLSAVQIGVLQRVIVVDLVPWRLPHTFVMVNPSIRMKSAKTWTFAEGCLSLPDTLKVPGKVAFDRPCRVEVDYQDQEGVPQRLRIKDCPMLLSRVIQHEIDHLDGKLITDYLAQGTAIEREYRKREYLSVAC